MGTTSGLLFAIDNGLKGLLLASFLLGYLLGSIPFGLILTRLAGLGDVRDIGSGNIGATNVLRTGNKKLAAATLLLDGFKGWFAVMIAATAVPFIYGVVTGPEMIVAAAVMAGLGAFLGHLFPLWLQFRGGKGVATYIGVMLALSWPVALIFCGVWLVVALVSKYSSLAALVAALIAPIVAYVFNVIDIAVLAAVMSLLLFVKHRGNIGRLIHGEEPKIGGKSA